MLAGTTSSLSTSRAWSDFSSVPSPAISMATVATVLSGLMLISGSVPGSSDLCSAAAFSSSATPSVTAGRRDVTRP